PLCSSDLNSLNYYLWRHLKSTVYATSVDTIPNCMLKWTEGTLNIYRKKLFSIFHRRK
ncbi:hypothetical protein ALC53_12544, partial [Atta colombica]